METELNQVKAEKSDLERKLDVIDSVLQQKLTRLRYLSIREELDAVAGSDTTQAQAETLKAPTGKESVELPPIVVRPSEPALS